MIEQIEKFLGHFRNHCDNLAVEFCLVGVAHAIRAKQPRLSHGGNDLTAWAHAEAMHRRSRSLSLRNQRVVGVTKPRQICASPEPALVDQSLGMFDPKAQLERLRF